MKPERFTRTFGPLATSHRMPHVSVPIAGPWQRISIKRPSQVWFRGAAFLHFCCAWAGATLVTIEPDDYSHGQSMTYAVDGVILTVADGEGKSRFPAEVQAFAQANPSTGSKIFGRQLSGAATESGWFFTKIGVPAVLRADFASATDFVAIDVIDITSTIAEQGAMHAFNSEGRLLETSIVDFTSTTGDVGTATISRPTADIAYVLIGGHPPPFSTPWNIVSLDRLRFNSTSSSPSGAPWHMMQDYASSTSTVSLKVEGVGSDSTTIRYEGAWLGWASIDGRTGAVSDIQVAPGKVKISDFSLQVPLGGGFYVMTQSSGLAATITSKGRAVPVAPNGQILPGGIVETLDAGRMTISSNVPGVQTQMIDYSLNPEPLPPGDPSRLATTLGYHDEFGREWKVEFVRPVDSTSVAEANGVRVTVTEVGAIHGSGIIGLRSPYGLWLDRQGMPDLPFSTPNSVNGIENGILFALGLDAVGGAQVPWFPDPQNSRGWILELPPSGTTTSMIVETASGLTSALWNPIAATDISTGNAKIPGGANGTVQIVGRTPQQYFRLVAEFPAGW